MGINVDQNHLDTSDGRNRAGREDGDPNVGAHPVGVELCGPGVDEYTDRSHDTAWYHGGDPEFRLTDLIILAFEPAVETIVKRRENLDPKCESNSHGEIVEACNTNRLMISLSPQDWEGGKDKVPETVNVGDVNAEDLDDGLSTKEAEGTTSIAFE